MRPIRAVLAGCLAGGLLLAAIGPAVAKSDAVPFFAGQRFATELTGAAERPGPGDPDGSGEALIVLNPGQGTICWHMAVRDVDPILAAHIHIGGVDEPGPVILPLTPPTPESTGCASGQDELIRAIRSNPENYYVNVHNALFPAGALRGQLG